MNSICSYFRALDLFLLFLCSLGLILIREMELWLCFFGFSMGGRVLKYSNMKLVWCYPWLIEVVAKFAYKPQKVMCCGACLWSLYMPKLNVICFLELFHVLLSCNLFWVIFLRIPLGLVLWSFYLLPLFVLNYWYFNTFPPLYMLKFSENLTY